MTFFAKKEKYHAHTCVYENYHQLQIHNPPGLCYLTAYFVYNINKYFWRRPLLTATSERIDNFFYLSNQLPSNHKHPLLFSGKKTFDIYLLLHWQRTDLKTISRLHFFQTLSQPSHHLPCHVPEDFVLYPTTTSTFLFQHSLCHISKAHTQSRCCNKFVTAIDCKHQVVTRLILQAKGNTFMYLPAFRSPTMTNIAISNLRQPPMRPTRWFYNQTRGMENRILDKKKTCWRWHDFYT